MTMKKAFDTLDGLPEWDDPDVEALMAVVGRAPRENLEEIARSLLRCALGTERTGDIQYLSCLGEDMLVTMRLRSDPECEKALSEYRHRPTRPGRQSVDVREMLAERGLLDAVLSDPHATLAV